MPAVIAASGILVVVAFVTLIVGVFNTGLSLIWASIASSVLAAVFLFLGVMQTNKRRVAPSAAGSAGAVSPWTEGGATAVMEREPAPATGAIVEERPSLAAVPAESEEELFAPPEPKAKPAARKAAASTDTVVIVPDRNKFHKDTCRYAKNPAAMTMSKAAARRQGYQACGVCKP
jgi:hypothetical protein